MVNILDRINSPFDLRGLSIYELEALAQEIRNFIIDVVSKNGGHLASNLGAVELTLALHYCFDFNEDRLLWDVSHQTYTHKIITGRRDSFKSLRKFKGISGFGNPKESEYDPFVFGHAGNSLSVGLGLVVGNEILGKDQNIVVLIGDGAMTAGMAFEALNHLGFLKKRLRIILNDNTMSIAKTIGAVSGYLSRIRSNTFYRDFKCDVKELLENIPIIGIPVEKMIERMKEVIKNSIVPGSFFEELGYEYFGPINGHNIPQLIENLRSLKSIEGPSILHVITEKGKGFSPAAEDPSTYHGAKPFDYLNGQVILKDKKSTAVSYTKVFSKTLIKIAKENDKVVAITAAMPEGTGLKKFKDEFPNRYFDVGICEQHALGMSLGLSFTGLKPVVAIYSTFSQRGFDQIFHELSLQKANVVLAMDRAGIVGKDGPTHHGVFDIAYLRIFPNVILMAPKDGAEFEKMLRFSIEQSGFFAIRYPRCSIPENEVGSAEIEIGKLEVLKEGSDGVILSYGSMVYPALEAARLLSENDIDIKIINLRFAKPIDEQALKKELVEQPFVIVIEEHVRSGGIGSAILEFAAEIETGAEKIKILAIPNRYIEHGNRDILLEKIKLNSEGIFQAVKKRLKH